MSGIENWPVSRDMIVELRAAMADVWMSDLTVGEAAALIAVLRPVRDRKRAAGAAPGTGLRLVPRKGNRRAPSPA
jgi:hypothetical protein